MGAYLIYLLFGLGLVLFVYYLYVIFSGKSLARMIGTKDRYIWNGLKNISAQDMPYSGKRNTLFLDNENLVITTDSLAKIIHELKKTESIDNAVVIPFQKIVAFDYKRSVADWNVIIRLLLSIWNRLLKKNDFHLTVRFLDTDRTIKQFLFKASSMDADDFEATFADFDNHIYSGKVKFEAAHDITMPEEAVRIPRAVPVNASNVIADKEVTVMSDPLVLESDDTPMPQTPEQPDDSDVVELPEVKATEALVPEVQQVVEEDIVEPEPVPESPRRRVWFEEEFVPKRKTSPAPAVPEADELEKTVMINQESFVDPEQTVMMSKEDFFKNEFIFEKPKKR